MAWHVFVGDPADPPDWSPTVDTTVDDFDNARILMIKALAPFITDGCEDCRVTGTRAALDVLRMDGPANWQGAVDGWAYRITDVTGDDEEF